MEEGKPGSGRPEEDESGTGNIPGSPDDVPHTNGNAPDNRVAFFIRLLTDDDESSRWKAAETLGRIGDPAAVGPLIDTLWDDDARVRLKAAWALGEIGDMRAGAALRRLYRMERDDAREIIKEALEAINRKAGSV